MHQRLQIEELQNEIELSSYSNMEDEEIVEVAKEDNNIALEYLIYKMTN